MLKRTIAAFLCLSVVSTFTFAATYPAQLLSSSTGKPINGQLVIDGGKISFQGAESQSVEADDVSKITAGEFAKRRVKGAIAGAVLLTPIALFALIGKKKREMFALEYEKEGERGAMIVQVKKKIGFTVEKSLEVATGLEVEWEEGREPEKRKKKG